MLNIPLNVFFEGDGLTRHNNMRFTTYDRVQDLSGGKNCAKLYKGGWWYEVCHDSNLNGLYLGQSSVYGKGIQWRQFHGYNYSLKATIMMLRCK